jgi:hypothetical protein
MGVKDYVAISHTGKLFTFGDDQFEDFCEKNDFDCDKVLKAISKNRKFQDWIFLTWNKYNSLSEEKINRWVIPKYIGITPEGMICKFSKQNKFAKEYNEIRSSGISYCLNDYKKSHKNWHFFKRKKFIKLPNNIKQTLRKKKYTAFNLQNNQQYWFNDYEEFSKENNLDKNKVKELLSLKNPKKYNKWIFMDKSKYLQLDMPQLNELVNNVEQFNNYKQRRIRNMKNYKYVSINPEGEVGLFNKQTTKADELKIRSGAISECVTGVIAHYNNWRFFNYKDYVSYSPGQRKLLSAGNYIAVYLGEDDLGRLELFNGVKNFANKHSLSLAKVSRTIKNNEGQYEDWLLMPITQYPNYASKESYKYIGINKDGKIYQFKKQNKFADRHSKLLPQGISNCVTGHNGTKTHYGWKFMRMEKYISILKGKFSIINPKEASLILKETNVNNTKKLQGMSEYIGIDPKGNVYSFDVQKHFADKHEELLPNGISNSIINDRSYKMWNFFRTKDIINK